MKLAVVAMLFTVTIGWSALWQRLTGDTSSSAANGRGVKAFASKKYPEAAQQFRRANEVAPTAQHAFNAGTAEIAAGHPDRAARILAEAARDPGLRADAIYNRGNGALQANQLDAAIHDYIDALRLRPGDPLAKRNLEIALRQKAAQETQQNGKQPPQQPTPQQGNGQRPQPKGNQQQQASGDPNADALLRAVQQQEQEELQRMRKVRSDKVRVGW